MVKVAILAVGCQSIASTDRLVSGWTKLSVNISAIKLALRIQLHIPVTSATLSIHDIQEATSVLNSIVRLDRQ